MSDESPKIVPKRSRRRVAEMTPEEHEAHKGWQRLEHQRRQDERNPDRQKRAKPRRLMTEEERLANDADRRARDAERKRKARKDPVKSKKMREQSRRSHHKHRSTRLSGQKVYYENNHDSELARRAEYYESNRVEILSKQQAHYEQNKSEVLARNKSWRDRQSPEVLAASNAVSQAKHKAKDPIKWRAKKAKAGAKRRQLAVTPAWANQAHIDEIHKIRAEVDQLTGIAHEVDHIIPYAGKYEGKHVVQGLNHPENLMIVVKMGPKGNRSKGHRVVPGQGFPRGGIKKARAFLRKVQQEHR